MLHELFDAFKLNDKERKVAQCLCNSGPQRASIVAKEVEISRNTVRGILDKLVGDGFLVRSRKKNTHHYAIETAEGLRRAISVRRRKMLEDSDQQLQALERSASSLTNVSRSRRPQVTFYEGFDGIRNVMEDTLTSREHLRSWASFDINQETLPAYFRTYYKRRARRGIRMVSIHPDTPLARRHHSQDKKELRKSLLIPIKRFNLTPEIQVYDNKLNIVSWRDKIGVIVESEEIARAIKSIFDLCYECASKIQREKGR
jgi:sugar-specific transcriptional regulator TrmB